MLHPSADNPLRVALAVSAETGWRYRSVLRELLGGLARARTTVCLLSTSGLATDLGVTTWIRYPWIDLPGSRWLDDRRLVADLVDMGVDVLHAWGADSAAVVRFLARHLDVPYVLTLHEASHHPSRIPLSSLRCAALVHGGGSGQRLAAILSGRIHGEVCTIRPALPVDSDPVCFARRARVPTLIVPAATVSHVLLTALDAVARTGREFVSLVLDTGTDGGDLRQRTQGHTALRERLVFSGDRRRRRPVLRGGDLFLHLGGTVDADPLCLEAMSVGLAVVTDDPQADDGRVCRVSRGDACALAAGLGRLLDQPLLARERAAAAQAGLPRPVTMVRAYRGLYRRVREWSYGLAPLIPA